MTLKLFKSTTTAKAAVKKQALHLIPNSIKWMDAKESGYYVEFEVDNIEDVNELRDRGFKAILKKGE